MIADTKEEQYIAMMARAALRASAPELLKALQDTVRILEAVRMSAGLGKKQAERLDAAKALIAKVTA